MRAAILAVGSELLGSRRLDTNSLFLTTALRRFGVDLGYKAVIDDNEERIAAEVARLAADVDLLIVSGGLGPTADDVTREAVAAAFGRGLTRRPDLVDELRRRFADFGLDMPAVNEKQGDVIDGAEVLANRRGTAPGQRLETENGAVFLIPGVPTEARGMLDDHLEPWLVEHAGEATTVSWVLKLACVPESRAEADLEPFYAEFGRHGFSVLPSPGEITLQLTATGSAATREEWLEPRRRRLRALFSAEIFSDGDDLSLAAAAGAALIARGATVVTAESCTGGLMAQRLTETPGSSAYFLGSVVSYANEVKTSLLGVATATLESEGAVSEAVVVEMARGARRLLGADYAIAASGVAGPGGGSAEKPVGTVHLAVAGGGAADIVHRQLRLPGDRKRVRWLASQWGLDMLRRRLLADGT